MKIQNLFAQHDCVLSFEVFPPFRDGRLSDLFSTIDGLLALDPHFISVTYGAAGTTQDMTFEIASKIKNRIGTEVLAHLTCVNATQDEMAAILRILKNENIKNILALRGDPPKGSNKFEQVKGGFSYANELVEYITTYQYFSIGIAGYPEGHLEAPSLEVDMDNLKRKVDAGADFIITQLFFNNDDFYRFRDNAIACGIDIPIVPGIFPVFNYGQIQKITSLCGAEIPPSLSGSLFDARENQALVEEIGIDYAIRQCRDLLAHNVHGLHFYSMNRSSHVKKIVQELSIRT